MSRRRKKLPQESITCEIESLSHEGRGVSHKDGKTLFVEGALPGETVTARYVNSRRSYDELAVEEVLTQHPQRIEPDCQFSKLCGGCSMQHVNLGFQIKHKESVLLDHLRHFGDLKPEQVVPPLVGAGRGYRTKARLGVRYVAKRDEVLVGFRERYSNFLTAIDECPVLIESVGGRIPELKALIRGLSGYQRIPQIEVAAGDDVCALVIRHMDPLTEEDLQKLIDFSEQIGLAIYLQPKGPDTVAKLWPKDGQELLSYQLSDYDLTMQFHPMDFTQVNRDINRRMLAQALEWLQPQAGETILDLFCGLGNFTLPIARTAAHVVGVEGSEDMVRRGYANAELNGVSNVEFHAADLHLPLAPANEAKHAWLRIYDKVLLDPPRSGAEELAKQMTRFGAKRIVYVSCNPATLARDAGILAAQGYRLIKAGVMDMFPHTAHVESMALFEKA
ncbi:23S rRNA (uracil(1939)-C(5))-methyltransferase RlmD [Hahella aquimaris]|uniref:23S rRNA (uracil(1939)-C(5))-methyltransferase RlmD n=1 Tax=Hahella sp. HNIBRBA332 TaxID=3015983 RepID=UPI00273BC349|nr:23S rRNA (uracil(1939)-C(5))-methyltransferase RlmD [Hahella sp. HNIBRBA332]WLQ11507.1 23S rRNA (uracil(1939)-C(5))-methyltransferase RlmD [Hahella sp. HNIBRBA332]